MSSNKSRRKFLKLGTGILTGLSVGSLTGAFEAEAREMQEKELSFFNVVKNRRSVRKFKPTPIPKEDIIKMLEAVRLAPTSGNQQPWKFLVIQNRQRIEELKKECVALSVKSYKDRENPSEEKIAAFEKRVESGIGNYLSAPLYIVVLTDSNSRYPSYNHHDGSLAAGYLILAARALGYGTVYVTDAVPESVTKKVFRIPDNFTRVCFIPVGVPESWPESPPKKDLKEFIVNEIF